MKTKFALALGVVVLALAWMRPWQHHSPEAPSLSQDGSRPELAETSGAGEDAPKSLAIAAPDRSVVELPATAIEPDPERDLRGVVVDTRGQPIAGADLVVLLPATRQLPGLTQSFWLQRIESDDRAVARSSSAADGSFSIRLEPQRIYDLQVDHSLYARTKLCNLYAGEELHVVLARSAILRGTVVDATDASPIAGAIIEASPGVRGFAGKLKHRVTSDADGGFWLDRLPADFVQLEVEALGYARILWRSIVIAEGEEQTIEIELPRGVTIRGRVLDCETNAPIADAVLRSRTGHLFGSATVDAEGRYEWSGIPVGYRDSIVVDAPGFGQYSYLLGDVPPEGLERDFCLLPCRRAHGRVVDGRGNPVANASISATACLQTGGVYQCDRELTMTDAEGRFDLLNLRVDLRHSLLVHADGFALAVLDFPAREWEANELQLDDVVLERPGSISGRVLDAAGAPLAEMWVSLTSEPRSRDAWGPSLVQDKGYASSLGFGFGEVSARTDARGRYTFGDLPPGHCWIAAGVKGLARSAQLDFELEEGEHPSDVDLRIDLGLSIRGIVVDPRGHPVACANVSVDPASAPFAEITYDLTRADGSFVLSGLESGAYMLRAGPGGSPGALPTRGTPPPRGARPLAEGLPVAAAAGDSSVRVVLPFAATISGIVRGPDDQPLANAVIWLRAPGPVVAWSRPTTSDHGGLFALWVADDREVDLRVVPPNSESSDASCEVYLERVAPCTTDLEVKLSKMP